MSDATKRFSADKAQWQWDSAMEIYCEQTGKNPDDLTEQDGDIIWEYSGNHIAHFLTWIIKNDLLSDMHDDVPEDIEAVKAETMTGAEFLMNNCDYVLARDDLSDEAIEFAEYYYDDFYLDDYCDCVNRILGVSFSWDDYNKIKLLIDKAFAEFKKQKN